MKELVKQIADHCDNNDGYIHESNLENLINKANATVGGFPEIKVSFSDLFTASPFEDDSKDIIERAHDWHHRGPTEYWSLTEYGRGLL